MQKVIPTNGSNIPFAANTFPLNKGQSQTRPKQSSGIIDIKGEQLLKRVALHF